MQVQLTVSRAGGKVSNNAGDVVDVGEAEGQRMIAAGQAVAIKGKETATKKAIPQKAVKE